MSDDAASLIEKIERAFADVALGDGLSIHEAEVKFG